MDNKCKKIYLVRFCIEYYFYLKKKCTSEKMLEFILQDLRHLSLNSMICSKVRNVDKIKITKFSFTSCFMDFINKKMINIIIDN